MSGHPSDPEPEKTPEHQVPADSAELEQDQFALDAYGITTKFPLGEPDAEGKTEIPSRRSWKDVRADCVASLQQLIVGLVQLPVVAVEQSIRIVKNTGRLSKGIADIAQRLAGGRSRVDHSEDEKIAEAAERAKLPDSNESLALAEKATGSLEAQLDALRAKGIPARIVKVKGVLIIAVVAEEKQAAVIDTVKRRLPRLAQRSLPSDSADDVLNKSLDETQLSTRVRNCLSNAQILTLGDLCARSVSDVGSIHGIGISSMAEIRDILQQHGLSMRDG